MQFLKTLFWIVLTVIAVAFAFKNWNSVEVMLWGNIVVDVKLPILLLAAFLIGLLPMFVFHRAIRWRLRRKLEAAQRALSEATPAEAVVPTADPAPPSAALPLPATPAA